MHQQRPLQGHSPDLPDSRQSTDDNNGDVSACTQSLQFLQRALRLEQKYIIQWHLLWAFWTQVQKAPL